MRCCWPPAPSHAGQRLLRLRARQRGAAGASWASGSTCCIGLTGQVSFGHVGFYAIGAYTVAHPHHQGRLQLLGSPGRWPRCWRARSARCSRCRRCASRGPYLAMITIAFGFIVEHGIVEMREPHRRAERHHGHCRARRCGGLAHGERAMAMLAHRSPPASRWRGYAWLSRGTWGAAMRAVRDSETAAESIGLNPLALKTVAFALSALCAGAGRRAVRAAVRLRHAAHLRLRASRSCSCWW